MFHTTADFTKGSFIITALAMYHVQTAVWSRQEESLVPGTILGPRDIDQTKDNSGVTRINRLE